MENKYPHSCIDCGTFSCNSGENFPKFCVSKNLDQSVLDDAVECYNISENHETMLKAAKVECEHYCKYTRVEEIISFAKEMGFHKIGIATCGGLLKEAGVFAKILRLHGFDVYGVCCKAGMIKKTDLGIDPSCNIVGENACNPIFQAKQLNHMGTELNVLIGLCVGHDSLFYKYSDALVTTLITKDRVLGHNPAAALYTAGGYYKSKLDNIE